MLTVSQIKWASQHNWFVRDNGDGTIEVRDIVLGVAGGSHVLDTIITWSGNFRSLREWAGY